jgi:hypothetical protein
MSSESMSDLIDAWMTDAYVAWEALGEECGVEMPDWDDLDLHARMVFLNDMRKAGDGAAKREMTTRERKDAIYEHARGLGYDVRHLEWIPEWRATGEPESSDTLPSAQDRGASPKNTPSEDAR